MLIKVRREWERTRQSLLSGKWKDKLRQFPKRTAKKIKRILRGRISEHRVLDDQIIQNLNQLNLHTEQVNQHLNMLNRQVTGENHYRNQIDRLLERVRILEERAAKQTDSLEWLLNYELSGSQSRQNYLLLPEQTADQPLVSIIMPVWNRAEWIAEAVESVLAQTYSHWELLIIDDGSTDGTADVLNSFLHEERIHVLVGTHAGVSAARNRGLKAATGELVAYLDSDNVWMPHYLEAVVKTCLDHPGCDSVYAAQLVEGEEGHSLRFPKYERENYLLHGGIDLNAFAHRRSLVGRLGGFDETLTRLVDWDLIARYTAEKPPLPISSVGSRYRETAANRISQNGHYWRNRYRIQRKWQNPQEGAGLRVLYVVSDYPQLTETYIRWEIECMTRWGVDVHVWSRLKKTTSPYDSHVPHLTGTLEEAMESVKPNLVHFHWLNIGLTYLPVISRYGALATVRGHGYEYTSAQTLALLKNPTIQGLFAFPHYAENYTQSPKMHSITCAFNGALFYPEKEFDTHLVVRIASAKSTKGIQDFLETAKLCPRHRFLLILGRINGLEGYVDELIESNRQQGSPVEIRVNVPNEEAAAIVRKAGIYMHTYGDSEPFGMPVSIAEAMAAGCYTLARNQPGAADFLRSAGRIYANVEQAAQLISQTETWYAEDWQAQVRQSVEYAYERFNDLDVYRPLLAFWKKTVSTGVDPAVIIDDAMSQELRPILELILEEGRAEYVGVFERPFLTHLLGTYRRLKDWGCEQEVCYVGLVHSLYNAIGQQRLPVIEENRHRLRQLIGPRAERLSYLFQSSFRSAFDQLVEHPEQLSFQGRFSPETLELTEAEFRVLCQVHLAEWLEKRLRLPGECYAQRVYQLIAARLGGVMEADYLREVQGENLCSQAISVVSNSQKVA